MLTQNFQKQPLLFRPLIPKAARACTGAGNTEMYWKCEQLATLVKLSPVVDNHMLPEFIWKSVNYLSFSHTPIGIDGVLENTNTNIPSKSSYTKACP